MNKWLYPILLLGSVTSISCTQAIYGVPASQWEQMNDSERQSVMQEFARQEAINAQVRAQAEMAKQAAEKDKTTKEAAAEFERQCRESKEYQSTPDECKIITRRHFGW